MFSTTIKAAFQALQRAEVVDLQLRLISQRRSDVVGPRLYAVLVELSCARRTIDDAAVELGIYPRGGKNPVDGDCRSEELLTRAAAILDRCQTIIDEISAELIEGHDLMEIARQFDQPETFIAYPTDQDRGGAEKTVPSRAL